MVGASEKMKNDKMGDTVKIIQTADLSNWVR